MADELDVDIVVPTIGRPSLSRLLHDLAAERFAGRVFVVDDRRGGSHRSPLDVAFPELDVVVLQGRAAGPAAARNVGWRASRAAWVCFLDDDVELARGWLAQLRCDLEVPPHVAGSQGRVHVPLPAQRRPTDWERNVAGLSTARWITADMAYRRTALRAVGGFDERFPRAYREDADIALRVSDAGFRLVVGDRFVRHPVRPAPWYVSVAKQAGNADDALMRRVHGRQWRERSGAPRGALSGHIVTTFALGGWVSAAVTGRRRLAHVLFVAWLLRTASFAGRRVLAGPRTAAEVAAMIATSLAIPVAAVWHRLRGAVGAGARPDPRPRRVGAVLLDRDGTLIDDVPYNGDPEVVTPVPGARQALDRLRQAGLRVGIVTNQSGVARGLISRADVDRVNARVEQLLGPFDVVEFCPHGPDGGCGCRKPQPGLVQRAAGRLDVPADRCVVIGDIGADMTAAAAAGASGILVPTPITRREEITSSPCVAADLETAVDLVLGGRW